MSRTTRSMSEDGGLEAQARRWHEVKDLLSRALDLEPSERVVFLRQESVEASVREEVETLLFREERLGDFLEEAVGPLRREVGKDPDLGRRFGPYKLVKHLGSGGMGAVYLAEREPGRASDVSTGGFQQTVAVKVLKRGLDCDEILKRFHAERQILANLNHPNIARLLDGGSAEDGRPFIVMEWVDGQPIDVYCRTKNLGVRQRVELFREVCAAVDFAHRNLVVHRDLKPANILIDSAGQPKLLDFGIAKLLTHDPRVVEVVTLPGTTPLSLAYASPEQVGGGVITTATDVYGLGVVLYEVLTGRRPHQLRGLEHEQILKILREVRPPAPSVAVVDKGAGERVGEEGEGRSKAENRGLAAKLRGDLDNIVLRALESEPERRFSSPQSLSEDLGRYLEGLPVRSRPATFAYRAGKFVRRNLLVVTTVSLVALLLVGFTAAMTIQHGEVIQERDRANSERDRANSERDRANGERDRARTVAEVLVEVMRTVAQSGGSTVKIGEILRQEEEEIRREWADQPETLADLLEAMGVFHRNLAAYKEARSMLEEVLVLRLRLYGEDHPSVATALHNLALVERYEGHLEEAEKRMRRAIGIQRRALPETGRNLAAGLNNLALLLNRMERPGEAAEVAREALALKERLFGSEDLELTAPLNTLARVLSRQGKEVEAEHYYRRSVSLHRRLGDPGSPRLANTLNALGAVVEGRGDPEAAGPLYEEALEIRRALYAGGDHPHLVTSLNNLAGQRIQVGQLDEAQALLEKGVGMAERLLAEARITKERVGVVEKTLARLWFERGDLRACRAAARAAFEKLQGRGTKQHLVAVEELLERCRIEGAASLP